MVEDHTEADFNHTISKVSDIIVFVWSQFDGGIEQ